MTDSILDNKRSLRPRVDGTALHRTSVLDSVINPTEIIKLDIVANKVTMDIPDSLVATVEGSVDGVNYFMIYDMSVGDIVTYGDESGNHLVKFLKFTANDGSGVATVVGVSKRSISASGTPTILRKRVSNTISISDTISVNIPAESTYQYGSDSDVGVVAHWKMQELDTPIVDSKNSISCAATNASPTYDFGVAGTGLWSNFTGIDFKGTGNFRKATSVPVLNIGANDHLVFEFVASCPSTWTGAIPSPLLFYLGVHDTLITFGSPTSLLVDLWFDDGSESYAYITVPAINDDTIKKYRIVVNRNDNCEVFIDGVSQGTFSVAGIAGKTTVCQKIGIGGNSNDVYGWAGVIYEARICKSANPEVLLVNSGAPGESTPTKITIPPTTDLYTEIAAAITTLDGVGGGIIQLEAGSYVIAPGAAISMTTNNITIQGVGPSTVIETHLNNNEWTFQVTGNTVTPLACSNTTVGQTQITLTNASGAGTILAGIPIMIIGTDSNGVVHVESNVALADGNGTTGVVTLADPVKYTLTGVTMRSYAYGRNIHFKNFKLVHNSAITSHSFGFLYTYNCSIEDIEGDGGGDTTGSMNFASVGGNLYPQVVRCTAYDYNSIEHYGGNDLCVGMSINDVNYGAEFNYNNFDNCGNATLSSVGMWQIGSAQENCSWSHNTLTNSAGITLHTLDFGTTSSLVNCHIDYNTMPNSKNETITIRNQATLVDTTFNYNIIDTVQTATFCPAISMINPYYNSGLQFNGNTISNVASEALSLWNLSGATISNNTFTTCLTAIYPYNCNGLTVSGNICNGLGTGIYLYASDNITISGNYCNSCTGYAFKSDGGCNGVDILSNEFKSAVYGLRFGGADDDVLIDNNIATGNSVSNLSIGDSNSNFNITNNDLRSGTISLGTGSNIVFGAGNLTD